MKNFILKCFGLFVFAFLILSFAKPKFIDLNRGNNGTKKIICNECIASDTTFKHIKTIHEFLENMNFDGIVVYQGKVLQPKDSLLFKKAEDLPLHSFSVLHKPSIDSIMKYGFQAKKGLILLD